MAKAAVAKRPKAKAKAVDNSCIGSAGVHGTYRFKAGLVKAAQAVIGNANRLAKEWPAPNGFSARDGSVGYVLDGPEGAIVPVHIGDWVVLMPGGDAAFVVVPDRWFRFCFEGLPFAVGE